MASESNHLAPSSAGLSATEPAIDVSRQIQVRRRRWLAGMLLVCLGGVIFFATRSGEKSRPAPFGISFGKNQFVPAPRKPMETSGFTLLTPIASTWPPEASLEEVRQAWDRIGYRTIEKFDEALKASATLGNVEVQYQLSKAACYAYEGEPGKAYDTLTELRTQLASHEDLARDWLASVVFFQGVAALRRGENDNCILCRGQGSCILPIAESAVHTKRAGSEQAIAHFTEYLQVFPDDLGVKWLLNLAHMTLGEYPEGVNRRYLLRLEAYHQADPTIGQFADVAHRVGLGRFNEAGGAILEDFDNDGLLDVAVTSFDFGQSMALYRNEGDGQFSEQTKAAGVEDQIGALTCVQTDYNNDGLADIFIPRGAWLQKGIRPTLLRNEGDFRFRDVTAEAGLIAPLNSNAALWADFDNDGWLDLFVCCECQPHRLYRNRKDGTFEDVAERAGLLFDGQIQGKGCTWLDYDNDDYPDLFISYIGGTAQLYHNRRDGTFSNVTESLGINGPQMGFSCWAWDFDNDGWLDIFATSYDRTLQDIVSGLVGEPHERHSNKLFRNVQGRRFEDVTASFGLDTVFATMGSNYADFDNDGFLDMYLATGDPNLTTLVPNRMLKSVGGKRFSEVTSAARVGHLQKGHGVACGDWDRDGDVDLFLEVGGVVPGDRFHNALFQNPGHGHPSLTVKLVGLKTNRAALGARIKIVTAGDQPQTIHRHITQGSSFGSNPLEQTIGLGNASRVELLEVHWPTSGTTQQFRDIDVNQAIEITELDESFVTRTRAPVSLPE